jgi:Bacterial Ig domain
VLAATVATNGNVVSNVQFYDDATNFIGQVASPPYNYTWTPPGSGVYTIFARDNCNGGASMDSPTATIDVVNTNVNFGFELPVIGSGNFVYDPSGGSWVFGGSPGNGSGLVANGSGFSNPNAPQGVQAAFVQGHGAFSQALNGFTPGVAYTIRFSAAQRGTVQNGGESWNVMIDGAIIASFSPGGTSYTTDTATFTAWAGTHTLSFVGTDYAGGDNTVFIDNVSTTPAISQVPPAIVLSSPTNNAVFSAANPVNLAATVTPNGNTIAGVQFYSDATNLITEVTSPYTYAWSNANAGASTVFARLVFNGSNMVDSSTVNIIVTNPPPIASGIGLSVDGRTLETVLKFIFV